MYEDAFGCWPWAVVDAQKPEKMPNTFAEEKVDSRHEAFVREAIEEARRGARQGTSKQYEPFGAAVVSDGKALPPLMIVVSTLSRTFVLTCILSANLALPWTPHIVL
mmetsp:Transcript_92771/g.261975  ORF Transcript_92771/g.261975 Transcript_92771/m.261975 type:complete len:107 (-) Transcript_92771:229-549(-)